MGGKKKGSEVKLFTLSIFFADSQLLFLYEEFNRSSFQVCLHYSD